MGVVSNINRVLNAKSTGIFLFGFTGTYKVLTDYRKAPKNEKKNVLMKDTLILAGSAGGLLAYNQGKKAFLASPFKKSCNKFIDNSVQKLKKTSLFKKIKNSGAKIIEKPVEIVGKHVYQIAKDCVDNTLLVSSGILGAVGADYLIQIGHSHKNLVEQHNEEKKVKAVIENQNKTPAQTVKIQPNNRPANTTSTAKPSNSDSDPFNKFREKLNINIPNDIHVDEKTKKNIISNITNMPEMRVFSNTLIGLEGLRITEEKTFKDKLRRSTNSILKGTLVPMLFLSLTSNITKGMKSIYRVPIVFTSLVAGTMLVNKKIDERMNKQLSKNA